MAAGVGFVHGDVRCPDDLTDAGAFDVLLECSAEPSVHAGYDSSPSYVIHTNLTGTVNCLEAARRASGRHDLPLDEPRLPDRRLAGLAARTNGDRLDRARLAPHRARLVEQGHQHRLPAAGHRSLYGATKLASELLIEEYRATYGLRAVVNRCGVLSGPWQMGKVDQGFMVLWAARHLFGGRSATSGSAAKGSRFATCCTSATSTTWFGRSSSICHVMTALCSMSAAGVERSVSLLELTTMCRERSGRDFELARRADTTRRRRPVLHH